MVSCYGTPFQVSRSSIHRFPYVKPNGGYRESCDEHPWILLNALNRGFDQSLEHANLPSGVLAFHVRVAFAEG